MGFNDVVIKKATPGRVAFLDELFFRFTLYNPGSGWNVLIDPYIPSDDSSFADGDAAKNCRIRVDDNVVFQYRMAENPLNWFPFFVERKAFGAESNSLIQFYIVANNSSLSNYHTGAMVDRKSVSDGCTRVNIDSCFGMCHFCNDTGNEWYS